MILTCRLGVYFTSSSLLLPTCQINSPSPSSCKGTQSRILEAQIQTTGKMEDTPLKQYEGKKMGNVDPTMLDHMRLVLQPIVDQITATCSTDNPAPSGEGQQSNVWHLLRHCQHNCLGRDR